ncbi:hypothetical protein [Leisingera methylohalidivorans]|uniref:Uncharacterized protein n=1 Tax=Leisingera methylohalidivorans DSM 14336 TaxID=999552 RepID=V9W250_9RHOB|nr:hypothetical protein [Leisingera methylohalidivorans]AHD03735.1 hypothetical protein METH_23165 [Leisingera methylohalidivorans DSM 14336]
MQDPELEVLIDRLESRTDFTLADLDGVLRALVFLLPDTVQDEENTAQRIGTADGAMHVADNAFPDWDVHIRGRAYGKHGRWHCTLRENGKLDNDAAIGLGQSPVLAQAVLAAVLRLAMILKRD